MRFASALVGPGSAASHTKPAGSLGDNVIVVSLSFREHTWPSARSGFSPCLITVPALVCTLIDCLLLQRIRMADVRDGRCVRQGGLTCRGRFPGMLPFLPVGSPAVSEPTVRIPQNPWSSSRLKTLVRTRQQITGFRHRPRTADGPLGSHLRRGTADGQPEATLFE